MDQLNSSQTALSLPSSWEYPVTLLLTARTRSLWSMPAAWGSRHMQEPVQCTAIKRVFQAWILPARGLLVYFSDFLPSCVLPLVQAHHQIPFPEASPYYIASLMQSPLLPFLIKYWSISWSYRTYKLPFRK